MADQLAAKRLKMKKPEPSLPPALDEPGKDVGNLPESISTLSRSAPVAPLPVAAQNSGANLKSIIDDISVPGPPPPNPLGKFKPIARAATEIVTSPSPAAIKPVESDEGNVTPFAKLRPAKNQPPPPPPPPVPNANSDDTAKDVDLPKSISAFPPSLAGALKKGNADIKESPTSGYSRTDAQPTQTLLKKPSLTIEVSKAATLKQSAPIPESPSAPPPPTRKTLMTLEPIPASPLTGNVSPISDDATPGSVSGPVFQFKKAPLPPSASLAPPPAPVKTNGSVRKNSLVGEKRTDFGPSSPIVKDAVGEGPVTAGDAASFWKLKANVQGGASSLSTKSKPVVGEQDSQPESTSSPAAPVVSLPSWKKQVNDSASPDSTSVSLKKGNTTPITPNIPLAKGPVTSWKKESDINSSNSSLATGTKPSKWKTQSTDDNSKSSPQDEIVNKPFVFALKKQNADSVYDLDTKSKGNSRESSPTSSNKQLVADDGVRLKKVESKKGNDIDMKILSQKISELNVPNKSAQQDERVVSEKSSISKKLSEMPVASMRISSNELSSLAKLPTNKNLDLTKSQSFLASDNQTRDSSLSLDVDDIFSLDMFQQKGAISKTDVKQVVAADSNKQSIKQPQVKIPSSKVNLSAATSSKSSVTAIAKKDSKKPEPKPSRSIFRKSAATAPVSKKAEKSLKSPSKSISPKVLPQKPIAIKESKPEPRQTEVARSITVAEKKMELIKTPIPNLGTKLLASAPFKLKIYRETIPYNISELETKDLDLIATQIYQDLSRKHPGLSGADRTAISQFIEMGDKLSAIEQAMKSPGYFGYRFYATAGISNSDVCVDLNLGNTSLYVLQDFYGLVEEYHFDDLKYSRVSETIVNLEAVGNSKDFHLKDISADNFLETVNRHLKDLRERSKFAVAIANYKANDGSKLMFEKGAIINVIERDREQGWIHGQYNGVAGWFLDEYVNFLVDAPREKKITLTGESIEKSEAFQNSEPGAQTEADVMLIKSVMESAGQKMDAIPVSAQETINRESSASRVSPKSPLARETTTPVFNEKDAWKEEQGDRRKSTATIHHGPLPTFIDWATRNFVAEQSFVGTLKRMAGKSKNDLEDHWKDIVNRIKWTNVFITLSYYLGTTIFYSLLEKYLDSNYYTIDAENTGSFYFEARNRDF